MSSAGSTKRNTKKKKRVYVENIVYVNNCQYKRDFENDSDTGGGVGGSHKQKCLSGKYSSMRSEEFYARAADYPIYIPGVEVRSRWSVYGCR